MGKRLAVIFLFIMVAGIFVILRLWPARREAVFYPMGGMPFRVITYDRSSSDFKEDVKATQDRVEDLEDIFGPYSKTPSPMPALSIVEGAGEGTINTDMQRVIEKANHWWKVTDGAFDITVGPLIKLWKEAGERQILPTEGEIKNAMKGKGWLAFGGIAKGDIVDQVADLLRGRGVKKGVVEAGGDILAFGPGTFRFGIQDPMAKAGTKLIGKIEIPAGAIVTSGNYERFVEIGGKKYSHIIDPKTGMPIDNGLVAVTVVGDKCIDTDALATALMVMDREKAMEFLYENTQFKGILIEKDGDGYIAWTSADLRSRIHFERPWADRMRIF